MDLSVIVPTLNSRDQLAGCLDALAERAPDAEVIVVNGPSADGTTGMVQEHDGVDVLVEIADRTINVARNAGLDRASGDVVAFLDHARRVGEGWLSAVREGLAGADAVTGPTHRQLRAGVATETEESRTIAGRSVTYFNGGNVAIARSALEDADGFDEYLRIGGARDLAHRLAGMDYTVDWNADMYVYSEFEPDGGETETDRRWKYRSLAYRLVKNYGPRPTIVRRLTGHAGRDAASTLRQVVGGDVRPSAWFGDGRDVVAGIGVGWTDGLRARLTDRSARRNPNGRSARADRAVAVYDRR